MAEFAHGLMSVNDAGEAGFRDWLSQFPNPARFGFTRRETMTCSEIHLCKQAYLAGMRRGYVFGYDQLSEEVSHG